MVVSGRGAERLCISFLTPLLTSRAFPQVVNLRRRTLTSRRHSPMRGTAFYGTLACAGLALAGLTATPATAQLIITPTFDSSITGDPNAAAIEGAINAAIGVYQSIFANPINVPIYFAEGGGLGESLKTLYSGPYSAFRSGLAFN